jgi:hypothetical protein
LIFGCVDEARFLQKRRKKLENKASQAKKCCLE